MTPYLNATDRNTLENQVAELYIVFFGRAPDAEGMIHWVQALSRGGMTINDVAAEFARSTEFQLMYGDLTGSSYGDKDESQTIRRFYQNALDRKPDADGLAFWLSKLKQGHTFAEIALGKIETAFAGGDAAHPDDTAIVRNKVEIAKYVSLELGSSGRAFVGQAFRDLTADPKSVSAVESWLHAHADFQPKTVDGNRASNVLIGGAGDDILTGNEGADTLIGGLGNDKFVFNPGDGGISLNTADIIVDFSSGSDEIHFPGLEESSARAGNSENVMFERGHGRRGFEDFVARANEAFSKNYDDPVRGEVFVYLVTNANDSGDTWIIQNRGDLGSVDAADSLIILSGIDSRLHIQPVDFWFF